MAGWATSTFQGSEEAESIGALLSSDLSTSQFLLQKVLDTVLGHKYAMGSKWTMHVSAKQLVRQCFTCQGRR